MSTAHEGTHTFNGPLVAAAGFSPSFVGNTSITGTLAASSTITAEAGLTVTAGGLTVTAGGATVTAGGLAVVAGAVSLPLTDYADDAAAAAGGVAVGGLYHTSGTVKVRTV